jgi:hypothetical protein
MIVGPPAAHGIRFVGRGPGRAGIFDFNRDIWMASTQGFRGRGISDRATVQRAIEPRGNLKSVTHCGRRSRI